MSTASTSGGFLIFFIILIVIGIVGATVGFRFRYPDLWHNSILTKLYRPGENNYNGRLIMLMIIGAILALTVALPRWTRSSSAFVDTFVGQGMFATCSCGDPSIVCREDEQTAFRAVQGFSVLGLLAYFFLAVIAGFGSKLELENSEEKRNASSTSAVAAASSSSSNNTNNNATNDRGGQRRHTNFTANAAGDGTDPTSIVPMSPQSDGEEQQGRHTPREGDNNNNNGGGGETAVNAPAASSSEQQQQQQEPTLPLITDKESLVGVAYKVCLVLLPIAWFCSLCSWAIFINLTDGCQNTGNPSFDLGSTNLTWGWVFRLFEWFFITALAVVIVLRYFEFVTSFNFRLSRIHFFSLLMFCLSSLTTTTTSWSRKNSSHVSPFYGCVCAGTSCDKTSDAQGAQIAFFILFLLIIIPRNFYYMIKTNVWVEAIGPTINTSLFDTVRGIVDDKLSARAQNIIAVVFSSCMTFFLFLSLLIMCGVLASADCGSNFEKFSSDLGLVLAIFVLMMCVVETTVLILDSFFDKNNNNGSGDRDETAPETKKDNDEGGDNESNSGGKFTELSTVEPGAASANDNSTSNQKPSHKKYSSSGSNNNQSPVVLAAPPVPPPPPQQHEKPLQSLSPEEKKNRTKERALYGNAAEARLTAEEEEQQQRQQQQSQQQQQQQPKKKNRKQSSKMQAVSEEEAAASAASAQQQQQQQQQQPQGEVDVVNQDRVESEEHPPYSPAGDQ